MRRNIAALVVMIAFAALGASGCATTLDQRPVNLAQHAPETPGFNERYFADAPYFVFSGQPTEEGFRALREQGIGTVLNIRSEKEMTEKVEFDEPALVRSLGMKYESIPITPDTFSVNDVERFEEILQSTRKPIVIHCSSSNRSGGLWAAYLAIKRGVPLNEAIEIGKSAGLSSDGMIRAVHATVAAAQENEKANDR